MRVLIACEYSGRMADAFLKRGHTVVSCDLLPREIELFNTTNFKNYHHYMGDVMDLINDPDEHFDLMICFPPCNKLTKAGALYWEKWQLDGSQDKAIEFVKKLFYCKIPKVVLENSVGILSTVWMKPTQIIHPYHFGEPIQKRTCLWIKGLPRLKHTKMVKPLYNWIDNSRGGILKDGTRKKSALPGLHRDWKKRSLQFEGIAQAMAEQYG